MHNSGMRSVCAAVLWMMICGGVCLTSEAADQSRFGSKSSGEIEAVYSKLRSGEKPAGYSLDDGYEMLQILTTRNDPVAYRLLKGLIEKTPGPDVYRGYIVKASFAVVPSDGPTEWFLCEREWAYRFFAKRDDFPDSATLLGDIKNYPCLIPYAAEYIVAKRGRFTPQMKNQLGELDLSADGPYFDAWARYLKIRILDRPAEEVKKDSLTIREAFFKSLETCWENDAKKRTNNFFSLIEPVAELAKTKNVIAIQSMFMMMPKMDGSVGETMSFEMEKIAQDDFDYFIENAHAVMNEKAVYDLLEGIWACDLDREAFVKKYGKQIADKNYKYAREIHYLIDGPENPDKVDLNFDSMSSKELIRVYQDNGTLKQRIAEAKSRDGGEMQAQEDHDKILMTLYERQDRDACEFFRDILRKSPENIERTYIDGDIGETDQFRIGTERFLNERARAYWFFIKRNDFVDSPTLFAQIRQYPCLLPHAAYYIISKRGRFTPQMRDELNRLDLSADGAYFDAWARYLKVKILDRPADQVDSDTKFICAVFNRSMDETRNDDEHPINNFYWMLGPVADLARDKDAAAMQAMFDMLPQMDAHPGEMMDGAMASIATVDFDFFIESAKKALPKDKLDDLLIRLWSNENIFESEFKPKYAAKINDKNYAHAREMNVLLNGLPGHKRVSDNIRKK